MENCEATVHVTHVIFPGTRAARLRRSTTRDNQDIKTPIVSFGKIFFYSIKLHHSSAHSQFGKTLFESSSLLLDPENAYIPTHAFVTALYVLQLRPSSTPTIRKANRVNKIFSEPTVFCCCCGGGDFRMRFAYAKMDEKTNEKICSEPIIIIISLHMPSLALRFHFILFPKDAIHVLFSVCVHRFCFVVVRLFECMDCRDTQTIDARRRKTRNERRKKEERSRTTDLIWFVEFFV